MKFKSITAIMFCAGIASCSDNSANGKPDAANTDKPSQASTAQSSPPQSPIAASTLVFVHGAHSTASVWTEVTEQLTQDGFTTHAVNLPGRTATENPNEITLDKSSQALCESIKDIDTKITFIAHSQGGAVVNNSLSICPTKQITNIIYLTAVAPLDGDTPYSLLSKADETHYLKGIQYDEKTGWMSITDRKAFASVFSNSQSQPVLEKLATMAVNEPAVIGEGVSHFDSARYAQINKSYIYTEFDKIISLASQKTIAKTVKPSQERVLETGHMPMISAPGKLVATLKSLL